MRKTPRFIAYVRRKKPVMINRSYRLKPSQRKAMKIDISEWKKALKAASEAAAVAAYALSGLKIPFIDHAIDLVRKEQDEAHRTARHDFEIYRLGVWHDAPVLGMPLPEPDETLTYLLNGDNELKPL